MVDLMRHTAVWEGWVGAPGYSNFYHRISGTDAAAAQSGHDAVAAFFFNINGYLPAAVGITVDPLVQILSEETGDVVGEVTVGTPVGTVTGNSGANWAANSGFGIDWLTGQFIDGRRVRGRTYLVPAIGVFDDDGTLAAAAVTALQAAALFIVEATQVFVVWHRPVAGAGGSSLSIASALVRDRAYVLRSRGR